MLKSIDVPVQTFSCGLWHEEKDSIMQFPRHVPALLCTCLLLSVAALASLAIGSAASEQMAAKRRISLQLRQDMEQCEQLDRVETEFCLRQARAQAEMATAELQTYRQALRKARMHRVAAHHQLDATRCNGLPRRLRERCVNALPAPETS
ncbi:MAG: hypothetical protein ABWY08_03455 [Comamonas sp.]